MTTIGSTCVPRPVLLGTRPQFGIEESSFQGDANVCRQGGSEIEVILEQRKRLVALHRQDTGDLTPILDWDNDRQPRLRPGAGRNVVRIHPDIWNERRFPGSRHPATDTICER